MNTLGIHTAHDSNIAVVQDGRLLFYAKEESFSNVKRDNWPAYALEFVKDTFVKQGIRFDIASHTTPTESIMKLLESDCKKLFAKEYIDYTHEHHLFHATQSFYDSGFDEAYNVVIDGNGSLYFDDEQGNVVGREHESIYIGQYPAKFLKIRSNQPSWYGVTLVYALVAQLMGLSDLDGGKTMGLAAYGKETNLPPFFDGIKPYGRLYDMNPIRVSDFYTPHKNRGILDKDLLASKWSEFQKHHEMYNDVRFIFLNIFKDLKKLNGSLAITKDNFQDYANLAKKVQKESEDAVINFILDNCDFDACKNITLSGGYALNCLNNYRLLHELPEDVNLFIQPNADDSGISIGLAKFLYYNETKSYNKYPLENIYAESSAPDYNYFNNYVQTQIS